MDMTNLRLSQGDSEPISSPSPFKVLYSATVLSHFVHWGVPPPHIFCTYLCLRTTKSITVLHFSGWHSWLFIYLDEGLFSYTEHSSTGDSLRRGKKKKVLRHIKNWLILVAVCHFSIWHLSLFFFLPGRSVWLLIQRGFSCEVRFSKHMDKIARFNWRLFRVLLYLQSKADHFCSWPWS